MYNYKIQFKEIIDGDTFDVLVDLGFYINCKITIRLKDINTPEVYRPINEAEQTHGNEVIKFLQNYIDFDKWYTMKTEFDRSFDRWVGRIFLKDDYEMYDLIKDKELERLSNDKYKNLNDLNEDKLKEYFSVI